MLISLTTSCSSTTPSDEIPPVAKDIKFISRTSREIWGNSRERYLKTVETNLYEEGGITDRVIESLKTNNRIMTIDKEIFLIQSCQHGNTEACAFITSQSTRF
ncbi:hypothetical protein [Rivularia sp. UHCC 0363]|uniref:hypothetical protein n=1 Tax=Rivularia sp. UHCC 0363 TaxID=3110244 RepID=UPI002B1FE5F4|nr:hypothetical protein [Rivularia sp. UHCC 0363]MEA5597910.1 hypothetical protein [Rivularia sp. UHCC 0363]